MRGLSILCVVLLQLTFLIRSAQGQEDALHSASARALFEEGVQLADSEQWSSAADRFRRALALRDSQVIRFNLAAALVELGQVVEASELLQQVQRSAGSDEELRKQAEEQLALATRRQAKLTIVVSGGQDGDQVMLGQRELSAALVGIAVPVDPGAHTVKLVRQNLDMDVQRVQLSDGAATTVTLHAVSAPSAEQAARTIVVPVAIPATAAHDDASDAQRRTRRLWWGVGSAVVVVAAAVVIGVLAASKPSSPAAYQGDFEPGSIPVQVTP